MSPRCSTLLMSSMFILQSSRVQISTTSTTLAQSMRSPQMLKLATSTSGMSFLHHCFSRRAKQKLVWDKLITQMKKVSRKSIPELDDDRIRSFRRNRRSNCSRKRYSEILRYENQASLSEDYIRGLKSQIESQELDVRCTLEWYSESRREQDLLHQEVTDRERDPRETHIRDSWSGSIEESSWITYWWILEKKNDRGSNNVNELTGKVQELQNEINCMNDSRDFKDAESVRCGQLSHVLCELALFPLPTDLGGLLSRARNSQPDIWNTHGISWNVFASSPAYSTAPCSRILNSWNDPAAERVPAQASTGTPVVGMSDRDKHPIPTPRFQRSSSAGKFIPLHGEKKIQE